MKLIDLIEAGEDVSVTIRLSDLHDFVTDLLKKLKPEEEPKKKDEYLSRKEVLGVLKIESSTLWAWEKTGYIKSFPFGGRKRYKLEDVEEIRTGKRGRRYQ